MHPIGNRNVSGVTPLTSMAAPDSGTSGRSGASAPVVPLLDVFPVGNVDWSVQAITAKVVLNSSAINLLRTADFGAGWETSEIPPSRGLGFSQRRRSAERL